MAEPPNHRNQPYDPPPGAQQASKDPKIARIQEEIDETKNVMRSNLENLQERGESLNTLEDKTRELLPLSRSKESIFLINHGYPIENLSHSAQGFRRGANRVRRSPPSLPRC